MESEALIKLIKQKASSESDDSSAIKELLLQVLTNGTVTLTAEEQIERLNRAYQELQVRHTFEPGQIVKWKTGLRNKRLPKPDQPALVVKLIDPPISNEREGPGSAYFRECLDIVLGLIDPDGDFSTFYFDSQRFQPLS